MRMCFVLPLLCAPLAFAGDPKLIDIPDKDGSVYHVPADDAALIAAVKAKIAGTAAKPIAAKESKSDGSALADLNRQRAARGLKPYIEDPALTQAAEAAAQYRAARGIAGHCNDFSFLPTGVRATAAGCAANDAHYGFMACCCWENYTYAGAAWVNVGGRLFCHLFVR